MIPGIINYFITEKLVILCRMFRIKVGLECNFIKKFIIYKHAIYMSRPFFKENIKYGSKNMEKC